MKSKTMLMSLILALTFAACQSYTDKIMVEGRQFVYPVLTMREHNPVLCLQLIRDNGDSYQLKELDFTLDGSTCPDDISSASLFLDEVGSQRCADAKPENEKLSFKTDFQIDKDTLLCWITLKLKDTAAQSTNKIQISCNKIRVNYGLVDIHRLPAAKPLRVGVALRQHGQDGVHTSRIPGLTTSKKGTLLALYDARNEKDDDLQGDIDIAVNRSEDGGCTWQPIQKVLDMGEWGGLPERYNGVSDGCILSDDVTGDLYVIGLWMHGVLDPKTGKWIENLTDTSTVWNHQWRAHGSQPGYGVKQSSQFLISKSTDDGRTWSEPRNITRQVKQEKWWLLAPAPGRGITMEDGTLVFPVEGRDEKGLQFSTIMWSKDRGENWTVGEPAYFNTNECQVVELSDHSLMLNMRERSNRGRQEGNGRAISVTRDLGKTWVEHSTSRSALIEPACQASLLRHNYVKDGKNCHVLLFANPSSKERRDNITIKVSFDDGQTWPEEYWLLLDEGRGAGYSCMTSIDEQTIGIFYEGSQADIQFQAIPLSDLLKE
ncbi:exo-alpha-sialidase [Bacteroides sp.]|uniref:exo-alpha-sialidase n=1 Tax=Bacteroides sp. TaxID=29523 RepID=UPI003AB8F80A